MIYIITINEINLPLQKNLKKKKEYTEATWGDRNLVE